MALFFYWVVIALLGYTGIFYMRVALENSKLSLLVRIIGGLFASILLLISFRIFIAVST